MPPMAKEMPTTPEIIPAHHALVIHCSSPQGW